MRHDIRLAFTVPGESFLEVLDELVDSPIRTVSTRHEAGAGFMAEAVGQLTGRPAALLVTRAVGAANASIALHTARQDSSPLICICGDVPRRHRGREAFQEADLPGTFGALCKSAARFDDPARAAAAFDALCADATAGRPGPVLAAFPEDVLAEPAEEDRASAALTRDDVDPDGVRAVLERLALARRPVVLAGAGVLRSDAVAALRAFSARWHLPVIASWRRPDVFPHDDGRYLGMAGLSAPPTVRARLLDADVILLLGCRLSQVTSFDYAVPAAGTAVLHVDVAPGFPGDRPQPEMALPSDAAAFLAAAGSVAPPRATEDWDRATAADRDAFLAASALPQIEDGEPVHPATVIRALQRALPGDAIVTTDAGNFAGWAARHLPLPAEARFLGPTSGAMGYALPGAIGASLAAPGSSVVALAGDGGFAMLMAELETAVREDAPLVLLVFDNGQYGTIRMYQEAVHPGRAPATELGRIDVAAVARACGAQAVTVSRDADVPDAVSSALGGSGVRVVHLLTDPRVMSVDAPQRDPTIRA